MTEKITETYQIQGELHTPYGIFKLLNDVPVRHKNSLMRDLGFVEWYVLDPADGEAKYIQFNLSDSVLLKPYFEPEEVEFVLEGNRLREVEILKEN